MVYKCEYSGELSKLKPILHSLRINTHTLLMVLETMPGNVCQLTTSQQEHRVLDSHREDLEFQSPKCFCDSGPKFSYSA